MSGIDRRRIYLTAGTDVLYDLKRFVAFTLGGAVYVSDDCASWSQVSGLSLGSCATVYKTSGKLAVLTSSGSLKLYDLGTDYVLNETTMTTVSSGIPSYAIIGGARGNTNNTLYEVHKLPSGNYVYEGDKSNVYGEDPGNYYLSTNGGTSFTKKTNPGYYVSVLPNGTVKKYSNSSTGSASLTSSWSEDSGLEVSYSFSYAGKSKSGKTYLPIDTSEYSSFHWADYGILECDTGGGFIVPLPTSKSTEILSIESSMTINIYLPQGYQYNASTSVSLSEYYHYPIRTSYNPFTVYSNRRSTNVYGDVNTPMYITSDGSSANSGSNGYYLYVNSKKLNISSIRDSSWNTVPKAIRSFSNDKTVIYHGTKLFYANTSYLTGLSSGSTASFTSGFTASSIICNVLDLSATYF